MSATGDIRAASSHTDSGFTLIEMLVTLGIAALIAGIAFPGLQRALDLWGQRAALASVRSALAEARSLAVRSGSPVSFTLSGDGFAIGPEAVRLAAPSRLSGSARVTFYPDGSASGGRIAIMSGARRTMLTIAPGTGLVQ